MSSSRAAANICKRSCSRALAKTSIEVGIGDGSGCRSCAAAAAGGWPPARGRGARSTRCPWLVHARSSSTYTCSDIAPAAEVPPVNPVEVRLEVRPCWHFRLRGRHGRDGLTRFRGGVLHRLLHTPDGVPVVVRVAQTAPDAVLFGGTAPSRSAAHWGIGRLRRALGVDLD